MYAVVAVVSDGEHARLGAYVPHVRRVEIVGNLGYRLVVDIPVLVDLLRVNLKNLDAPAFVWQRNLNLAIQPPRSHQRRVQHVRPVRRHHHLDLTQHVEPVHLVQQLHQRSLNLAVRGCALAEALTADGVDLVHEDDARLVLPGVAKHLANQPRGLADVLVHDGGGDHFQKVGVDVARDRLREQGFSRSGGSVE